MSEETSSQTMAPPEPKKGVLGKLMDHPWFVRIAALTSVIALPLSFYFYWESIQKPELSYAINPVRTSIVKADKLSHLKVEYWVPTTNYGMATNDLLPYIAGYFSRQITNDLTSVQIAIWNNGKKPIHHDDILEPIKIHSVDGSLIYEANTNNVRSATGLKMGHALGSSYIELDWKVLEYGDGALITVFYGGNDSVNFAVDGTIEGQGNVRHVAGVNRQKINNVTFGIMMFFMVMSFVYDMKKKKLSPRQRKIMSSAMLVFFFAFLIVFFTYSVSGHLSPFGF